MWQEEATKDELSGRWTRQPSEHCVVAYPSQPGQSSSRKSPLRSGALTVTCGGQTCGRAICAHLPHTEGAMMPHPQTPSSVKGAAPEQLIHLVLWALEQEDPADSDTVCMCLVKSPRFIQSHPVFTGREHEVLSLIADGLSNKAISQVLGISVSTVKFHIRRLLEKLNAHSRVEAVAIAMRAHLLSN